MAGRGRGRGRSVSFNVEALGFGRGEALPGPIQQPPPLFPAVEFHPIPLGQGDEYDYMLALKQEFRVMMRKSPYSITSNEKRKDIVRYSDKYQLGSETVEKWTPDYSILPAELKPKKARRNKKSVKPNIQVKKKKVEDKEITKTLEELEKKEETSKEDVEGEDDDEDETDKKGEDGEEEVEEEEFEEEEAEEETDYLLSYFDNGEEYGNDDDDVDEGPVY